MSTLNLIPDWILEYAVSEVHKANMLWAWGLCLLLQYVHKSSRLPEAHTVYKGVQLGRWCNEQRRAYRGIGGRTLVLDRIKALEGVPGWQWSYR